MTGALLQSVPFVTPAERERTCSHCVRAEQHSVVGRTRGAQKTNWVKFLKEDRGSESRQATNITHFAPLENTRSWSEMSFLFREQHNAAEKKPA